MVYHFDHKQKSRLLIMHLIQQVFFNVFIVKSKITRLICPDFSSFSIRGMFSISYFGIRRVFCFLKMSKPSKMIAPIIAEIVIFAGPLVLSILSEVSFPSFEIIDLLTGFESVTIVVSISIRPLSDSPL